MKKIFCCEDISKIENYNLALKDEFKSWVIHHRLETHDSDGNLRMVQLSREELIALDMYYNRPASELIYLKRAEHNHIHQINGGYRKGKEFSEKTLAKLRGRKLSEETRLKMKKRTNGMLGKKHSEETRLKMSQAKKGKHWKLVDGKRVFY